MKKTILLIIATSISFVLSCQNFNFGPKIGGGITGSKYINNMSSYSSSSVEAVGELGLFAEYTKKGWAVESGLQMLLSGDWELDKSIILPVIVKRKIINNVSLLAGCDFGVNLFSRIQIDGGPDNLGRYPYFIDVNAGVSYNFYRNISAALVYKRYIYKNIGDMRYQIGLTLSWNILN